MIKTPVKVEVFATFRKRPDRWGIVDADDKNIDGLWAFSEKSIADFIAHCINQHEGMGILLSRLDACLMIMANTMSEDGLRNLPSQAKELRELITATLKDSSGTLAEEKNEN